MNTPGIPLTDPFGIAALLRPIPRPADPVAVVALVRTITEARREDDARLPQGIWARDIKRADWPLVERLCADILRDHAKHMQAACWLAEAWVSRAGFAGLAAGLRLLATLCRDHWPDLEPAIEDGDCAARIAPLEWLNRRFPALLRDQPIARAVDGQDRDYTWTDYINAQLLEALRQRDPKSVERSEAAGAVTLAAFAAARDRTDPAVWQVLDGGLRRAAEALDDLNASLERACARDAPGLGALGTAIRDLRGLTAAALAGRSPAPSPSVPATVPATAFDTANVAPTLTRAAAYARLTAIADALQEIEPHSPVPYLVRRAVEWGDMSLPDLMTMFANAGLDLVTLADVLGITATTESDDGGPGHSAG